MKCTEKGSDPMHDFENRRYATRNGYIKLTPYENIILGFMIANKGELVIPYIINKRIKMTRLKNKLKGEVEIKSKWGLGYYID